MRHLRVAYPCCGCRTWLDEDVLDAGETITRTCPKCKTVVTVAYRMSRVQMGNSGPLRVLTWSRPEPEPD